MRSRLILTGTIALIVGALFFGVTSTSAAPPSPSPTEVVGFLDVAGVKGTSVREGAEDTIEVRSFDFAVSKAGGKAPKYRQLQVAAGMEAASVALLDRLSLGTSIPTVRLTLRKFIEGAAIDYKTYTLSSAKVVKLREYASGQGSDVAMMEVAFTYKKIDLSAEGAPDMQFCWNLVAASKC